MFKAGEYKIVFKRRQHQIACIGLVKGKTHFNGRYDTVCEFWIDGLEVPKFTGIAKLHPNDKVNKITGKKIALFKAMGLYWDEVPFYDAFGRETKIKILCCRNDDFKAKESRTEIWEAFWKWVKSWKNKESNEKLINPDDGAKQLARTFQENGWTLPDDKTWQQWEKEYDKKIKKEKTS